MNEYYFAISAVSFFSMLLLLCLICQNDVLPHLSRVFFALSALVAAAVIAAEAASVRLGARGPEASLPNALTNMLGFLLTPSLPLLLSAAINPQHRSTAVLLWIPFFANTVFCILSPLLGLVFTVTPENVYSRGSLFFVFVLSYLWGLGCLMAETFRSARLFRSKRFVGFLLFFFVCLGTSVQLYLPQYHLSWLCIAFAMVLYYAYFCELSQQLDPLTGLLNRRAYETHVQRLADADQVTIAFFDVDSFKSVNDVYGHSYGDHCLTVVSRCILEAYGRCGTCYRIGGDEFCVLSQAAFPQSVEAAGKDFLQMLRLQRQDDGHLPMVSIGSAVYRRGGGTLRDAIHAADLQMYDYKEQRRGSDPDQCRIPLDGL